VTSRHKPGRTAKPKFHPERFAEAKAIFATVEPLVEMQWFRGLFFKWRTSRGVVELWRWVPEWGKQHPRYHNYRFPWGGTTNQLIYQLLSWTTQMPVFPRRVLEYWASPTVGLGGADVVAAVRAANWPADVPCVKCGRSLTPKDRFDWYDWQGAGVHCFGPGCYLPGECQGASPAAGGSVG
jgi:hypothetical protein